MRVHECVLYVLYDSEKHLSFRQSIVFNVFQTQSFAMSFSEAFSYTHTYILHTLAWYTCSMCIFNIFSSNNFNPEHKFHIMPPSPYKTHDTFFFLYGFWQSTVVVHNLAHKPNSSTFSYMLCPFRFHSVSIQISHFLLFDNRNVALHHHQWCACMLVIQMPFSVSFFRPLIYCISSCHETLNDSGELVSLCHIEL